MSARNINANINKQILTPHYEGLRDETTFTAIELLVQTLGEQKTAWWLVKIMPFSLVQAIQIVRSAAQGDSTPFMTTAFSYHPL